MDYCPNYLSESMQEQAVPASSILSLPYSMAMEDHMQSYNYLPLASMASAYMGPFISNEQNYTIMHEENLPKMDNLEPLNPMYAEPYIACTYPSSPLWSSTEPSLLAPSLPCEQGQYLLNLQALLKAQYGISLTLDQLLAFDALPALLHADNDTHAPHDGGVKLEDHNEFNDIETPLALINYDNMHLNQVLQVSQGANVCVSPLQNKILCVNDSYRPQDISSPGSAASSSVVTDGENSDKLISAECIATHIPNIPSPLASVNSQSWINPSISWLPGGDERAVLQALNEMQAMEIAEPPAQRRKLQGITLDQVLQAEKMQKVNANPAHLQAARNPFLGRDVLATVQNGVRGGSYEANGIRDGSHEASRLIPQPRKPTPTSVEPQSIAARHRRKRIRERTESLGMIIPGATRLDTAAMFDLAIKYVHFLQAQMFCLENEVSLTQQRQSYEDESVGGFRRALIHRLLSSQDVQHFLSREGLCLVTEGLANRLNFDPSSVLSMKGPTPPHPHPPAPLTRTI